MSKPKRWVFLCNLDKVSIVNKYGYSNLVGIKVLPHLRITPTVMGGVILCQVKAPLLTVTL